MDNSVTASAPNPAKGPGFRTWLGPGFRTTRVQVPGREGSRFPDPYKPRRNHEESRPGIDITKTVASPGRRSPVANYRIRQWVKVANRAGFAQRSEVTG